MQNEKPKPKKCKDCKHFRKGLPPFHNSGMCVKCIRPDGVGYRFGCGSYACGKFEDR